MKGSRFWGFSLLLVVVLTLAMGCSHLGGERKTSKEAPEVGAQARYYHFQDVLIPGELKVKMDESFIYETPALRVGKLVFSGRVEAQSLTNFFARNMERDGWTLVNKFGFKDVVLNFSKPNRNCTVNILDKPLKTIVEVWVGPVGKER
jgi:hypothetical protein